MAESSPADRSPNQPIPLRSPPLSESEQVAFRTTVPVPLGRLIGREAEVTALANLVVRDDVRLLTVTGPGGVGKTRLVLGVAGQATQIGEVFGDRVMFVSLASIAEPAQVMIALARAFGVSEKSEPGTADTQPISQRLAQTLSGTRRLLILDNFEHVAAAGPSVAELAAMCPNLTVLITSRIRVRLSGEYEFPVSPLSIPETASDLTSLADNASVALFVARANAANPDFALSNANAPTVAQVCRKLDGLPLAIELAAARSTVLTPQAILTRLNSRLQLLSDGPSDAPTRLRSMRDAVAWSLDLLPDEAVRLFCRLSIVAGPITEEIAEALAGDQPAIAALTALIDAGLLQRVSGESGDVTHWRMLETVREVGRERLEAAGKVDEAYLLLFEWLHRLIKTADPEVTAGKQDVWFPRLEELGDTFRTVISWAIRTERPEHALNLMVGSLWFFWSMREWVRSERHALEAALTMATTSQPPVDPGLWARALFTDALYFLQTGDYGRARTRFQESLTVFDQLPTPSGTRSAILLNLGIIDSDQGDYVSARRHFEDVLAMRRESGNPVQISRVLINLGDVANRQGDYAAATDALQEALLLARQTGERRVMAHCLTNLGDTAANLGRTAEALVSFDQALGLFRQTADLPGEGATLIALAAAALTRRDVSRAATALAEVLTQQRETRTPTLICDGLDGAAAVAVASGRPDLAPRFLAVATAFRTAAAAVSPPDVRHRANRTTDAAVAALSRTEFDAAVLAARTLTTEKAIEEAVTFLESVGLHGAEISSEGTTLQPASRTRADTFVALTQRQQDVLRHLVAGLTDPEIGDELGISTRTVETHVSSILNKLRVHARTAAVAYAVRHGLI